MRLKDMEHAAGRVSGLMKMLSNKNRLLILCHLAAEEKSVGELADLVGVQTPAMSQQLALLRRDGLVSTRRDGQTIYYAVARGDVSRLTAFLYETYCGDNAES